MKIRTLTAVALTIFSTASFGLTTQGEGQGTPGQPEKVDQSNDQAKGTGGQNVATQSGSNKIIVDYRATIKDSSAITKAPPSKMIKPLVSE